MDRLHRLYWSIGPVCVLLLFRRVSCKPDTVSFHISESDFPEQFRILYDHHTNLTYVGEYARKIYDDSCLYPLETNRFAPADCVLSPRCGQPIWEKLKSRWYGQEWGICYGNQRFSKFTSKIKVYRLNTAPLQLRYDDFLLFFPRDVLRFLGDIYIGIDRNKYHLMPQRCLDYMPGTLQVPSGIRFDVVDEQIVYKVIAPDQFEKFCTQKPFRTLKDLIYSLPVYVDFSYSDYSEKYRLSWLYTECKNTIAHYDDDHCYCADDLNPNYKLYRGCDEKRWVAHKIHFNVHYSNPIVIAFRSVFQFLWHEASYLIEFILVTLFDILSNMLLTILSDFLEFCEDNNLKIFEAGFVGFITYLNCSKFVMSVLLSFLIVLFGLLI